MASLLSHPVEFSAAAPSRREPEMRSFDDVAALRNSVYSRALQAANSLPAYSNGRHSLRLTGVAYDGPESYSLRDQKQAILEGRTLGRRLRGTWELRDAEDNVVDSKQSTIASIPFLTDRGTFIDNGNEYSIINQFRLRPGVFTRAKGNGEIEAHANILPGDGRAHRYFLDPEKGVFYSRVGQAKIPLLPLLRAFGVNDATLREAWGPELLAANAQQDNPAALRKYFERMLPKKLQDADENVKKEELLKTFQKMKLDPEVSRRTLGQPYERLSPDVVVAVTRKLKQVMRGEADSDDRDALAFQQVLGPEDIIAERIAKDYGGARRALLYKASQRGNLKNLAPNALNKQVRSALLNSGLGQVLEEVNSAEIFDKWSRISRMGEGGIPSTDSVPDEARMVQPSHLAFVDSVRTPESLRAGVDLHLARALKKGSDGKIYAPFQDVRSGETVYRSPQDVADLVVAFPGEMRKNSARVWAMQGGRMRWVPRSQVALSVPRFEDSFSPLANMIPFKSSAKGQRVSMGARMMTQALPLKKPEAPLVQSGVPGEPDNSYELMYGKHLGALRTDKPARVMKVDASGITLRYQDGTEETKELYQGFPYARKTYVDQTPLVKPGDVVQPNQLLARSTYTDDSGAAALGTNARVGYIPIDGYNFEDAVVISESMAEKLISEHMYPNRLEITDDHKVGRGSFISLFPSKYSRKQIDSIDENGLVKPGTRVEYGDPLVLAAQANDPGRHRVHKKGSRYFSDASVTWDHHDPGVVTDATLTNKGASVFVRATSPMQVGDKLSGRYGDKGVVAAIFPDERMPQDAEGRPIEIAVNPLGVISRGNPAQVWEAALGKIAAKTGKPYRLADFDDIEDLQQFVERELSQHDVSDLEDVLDPQTGQKIKDVLVGNRFFMKLHHMAESKGQGRGTGGYSADDSPSKGGETGSKRVSLLDSSALVSHGAYGVLRDASQIRGQRNEDFWLSFISGNSPPDPDVPLVYKKFVNNLKAAGINVVSDGTTTHVMAMTDRDIDTLAGSREIKNSETVDFDKGLAPVSGGLFDPKLTGGHGGNQWSYVSLPEPLPNPAFEEPIRRLLGVTQKQFVDALAGREELPRYGGRGPEAISKALTGLNLDREIARAREEIRGSRKGARDAAIRRLGYLKSAERLGVHPKDWMLSKVPVLPPVFRPISTIGPKKLPLVSDPNWLYKQLLDARDNLKELSSQVDDVSDEREALYDSFKAVVGLSDPTHPKLQEKNVKGILKHVLGSSPKLGVVQRRLLSTTADTVGRGVIVPNPDLDMDSVSLPEDRAWNVYENFIVRRLKRQGLPVAEAIRRVEARTPEARKALLAELDERPVFVNRAPVLHRFGIMAFKPRLTKNSTVEFSPLIVKGFGADFNGDSCRTPLLPVLVNGKLFLGDFETFIQEHVMPKYQEKTAVEVFGRQTSIFEFSAEANVCVPGVGEDGNVGWHRASHISIHTSHGPDCYRVKTQRGLDAVFTAHHNFVRLDEDCRLVAAKTAEIEEGSLLPIVFGLESSRENTRAEGRPDLYLGFKEGFFIGHWLGDGSLTGRQDTVTQASCDKELQNYLRSAGKKFSKKKLWVEGNGKSVRWTDEELVAWFADQFGHGFAHKRIAPWCFTAPKRFREGLLLGFLAAEGSAGGRSHRAEVANRELLLGVQMIANTLGVAATVRPAKPKRKSKKTNAVLAPTFTIRVNKLRLASIAKNGPPLQCLADCRTYAGDGSHQVWDSVPYPKVIADKIDEILSAYRGGRGRWSSVRGNRKGVHHLPNAISTKDRRKIALQGKCTRAMAVKLIDQCELRLQDDEVIRNWLAVVDNHKLIWDVIESVEKVERPDVTYDFHVPDGQTFCIDGFFLTHNTVQYHVPVSESARREALERMLPSRNLLSPADFKSPVHTPGQEYVGGLYAATTPPDAKKRPHRFASKKHALQAFLRGELPADAVVEIDE